MESYFRELILKELSEEEYTKQTARHEISNDFPVNNTDKRRILGMDLQ